MSGTKDNHIRLSVILKNNSGQIVTRMVVVINAITIYNHYVPKYGRNLHLLLKSVNCLWHQTKAEFILETNKTVLTNSHSSECQGFFFCFFMKVLLDLFENSGWTLPPRTTKP